MKILRPQRVQLFFFLVFKQRLLTQAKRLKHGIVNDNHCMICGSATEDIMHSIRDCSAAREVWSHIVPIRKQT